jgi:quercetin dioxygenase-like cupin family protein
VKPRHAADTPATPIEGARDTALKLMVGEEDGAPNFVLRRIEMEPGGGMPLHTNDVEHVQYVLSGNARVTVGDEVHEVGADMSLFIPAGVPHAYQPVGDEPFVFLCAIPRSS